MITKGQMEAEITKEIVKIVRECTGRGPTDTKAYITEDLIVIRERDVLTPIEQHLLISEDPGMGRELIKRMRELLERKNRDAFQRTIKRIVGRDITGMYEDISIKAGERIIVFTLDAPVDFKK
ncbi:MAG TPA: DUF2294 domain-containing protein [Victivallales bacterium]|nr:DUF2294 domain-containing protein [Victivallales bacterium]